jgi:hypothetical protein
MQPPAIYTSTPDEAHRSKHVAYKNKYCFYNKNSSVDRIVGI